MLYCTGAALVPPVQHQGGGLHLPHPQGGQHHLAGLHGRSRWDKEEKYLYVYKNICREHQHEQTGGCAGPQVAQTATGGGAADCLELGGEPLHRHRQASLLQTRWGTSV